MNANAYQARPGLLREVLRTFLVAALRPRAVRVGLTAWGAGRAQRWMCCWLLIQWISGSGAGRVGVGDWLRRRRPVCLVYMKTNNWLRLPDRLMKGQLATKLGADLAPVPQAADPEPTGA
ncbi:MAG: hypothetical protein ACRDTD_20915 [Pseudonocardiaceae bacterium]